MPTIIDVTIKEVLDDELLLELPSGQRISWPNHDINVQVGDSFKLSLNSEKDIINQILKG